MKTEYNINDKSLLMLVAAVAVVVISIALHASVASERVEGKIDKLFQKIKIEDGVGLNQGMLVRPVLIPKGMKSLSWPGNGVYNTKLNIDDSYFYVFVKSYSYVLGWDPSVLGWYMPFPFVIPYIIHLVVVWGLVVIMRFRRISVFAYKAAGSFGKRVLTSAIYGLVLSLFFQSSRMVWGSEAWDGAYFVSYEYGWPAFYLFFGLCIAMYLYCVIGTAGLQVRRKSTAKKQSCIQCGYSTEGLDRCPECDLEVGAYIPSKWRINHWYLAAMAVVTFFSPVLVASVYSVFG